jgi:hypothetical protein
MLRVTGGGYRHTGNALLNIPSGTDSIATGTTDSEHESMCQLAAEG